MDFLQEELDAFASKFPNQFKVYYVLNQVNSFASTFIYFYFFGANFKNTDKRYPLVYVCIRLSVYVYRHTFWNVHMNIYDSTESRNNQ